MNELLQLFNTNWDEFQKARRKDRDNYAVDLLISWFKARFPQLLPPNQEQALIILDDHENTIVTARAGSGKTTLLIYKVLFLIEHLRVDPNQIILLAFNKSAAVLIKERLFKAYVTPEAYNYFLDYVQKQNVITYQDREKCLKEAILFHGLRLPHVMTFHALAYQIVKPSTEQFAITNDTNSLNATSFNQVLIKQTSNPEKLKIYLKLMFEAFCNNSTPYRQLIYTVDGICVNSRQDLKVGNFLFSYKIPYVYKSFRNKYYSFFQIVIHDQVVANIKTWEENLFAYESQGKAIITIDRNDFNKRLDLTEEAQKQIIKDLEHITNLVFTRSTDRELFSRAEYARQRMVKTFQNMILVCKHKKLTPEEYTKILKRYSTKNLYELLFINMFDDFYSSYEQDLADRDTYDFLKIFTEACQKVENNESNLRLIDNLAYIFVDEFQDFSQAYYDLLLKIREKSHCKSRLVAVGDDWQAINGYAGADLTFFTKFEKIFGKGKRLHLLTNYRSEREIINLSNELMAGLGKKAKAFKKEKGFVSLVFDDGIRSHIDVCSKIVQIVKYILTFKQPYETITVLTRTQNEVKRIATMIPNLEVNFSTVHGFKGSESDYVILDVCSWYFPLIHPDSLYGHILGVTLDKIEKEEQRLLYVALTRAKKGLYLVAESSEALSPFINDLDFDFGILNNTELLQRVAMTDQSMTTQVTAVLSGQTYEVKELLKRSGYQFDPEDKIWVKKYDNLDDFKAEFTISKLINYDNLNVDVYDYCNKIIDLEQEENEK